MAQQHAVQIQLLLTDLVMAGPMNGRHPARRSCQEQPNLKAVLFRGYNHDFAGQQPQLDEGQVFLAKPFDPETPLQKVRGPLDPMTD
ncbi:MAG: hypothetical protein RMN51_07650 [Verrucomicrobiota bacterium]|nr:hypothetical protein [Limisphaera sp.]MDW8381963.1 hypothetical protein [Verrucomicrobiota bacterium]